MQSIDSPNNMLEISDFPLLKSVLKNLQQRFPQHLDKPIIIVLASQQQLFLIINNKISQNYKISTAAAGLGNNKDSFKTPLGVHEVSEKFGDNAEFGTIFKARKNTFKQAEILTEPHQHSLTDNITSRILWLNGLEKGINQGAGVDTHERFIYIHGTDEEGRLGSPVSHGCIRMGNHDVIELYSKVNIGTLVAITP